MAATLTADKELTYFSFPIEKQEETPDGDIIVYGKCTDGSLDADLQVVDVEWSQGALKSWLDTGGNVRVQHQSQRDPAGVGIDLDFTPDGHYLKALVVEPIAKELVRKGVLRAYSIGVSRPVIEPDPTGKARNGIIKGNDLTEVCEVSLVDRPSNGQCGFQMVAKSANGAPEYVGRMFGSPGTITKALKEDTVSLDLPKDVGVSFSPADLAKLLGHRKVAEEREALKAAEPDTEKRQMDPAVGGGVDRDKIPAADFAGHDRSYPIVKPGDVSDAASSIGRAGSGNYSADELKRRIIAIARRKGDAFIAELPQKWRDEMEGDRKAAAKAAAKPKKPGKKGPFPGAHPAFGAGHQPPHTTEDEAAIARRRKKKTETGKASNPAAIKGMKDCKGCGMSYDADSKMRTCEGCGKSLPKMDKSATKSHDKVVCPGCGAQIDSDHQYCTECGQQIPVTALAIDDDADRVCLGCGCELDDDTNYCPMCGTPAPGTAAATKNHDFTCLGCGRQLDKGEKYCPGCGKAHPGYLPAADSKVKAVKGKKKGKGKPTPGAGRHRRRRRRHPAGARPP